MEQRQTSLEAFKEIQSDGTASTQREKIYQLLKNYSEGLTREEIRDLGSVMYTSVCARVRELSKLGLIYEEGFRINKSKKKACIVKVITYEWIRAEMKC